MKKDRETAPSRNERREVMEWLVGRYPDLADDELAELLQYMQREASATDVALIASNDRIRTRYRQLAKDHHLDRPGPVGWSVTAAVSAAIFVAFILAMMEVYP
jgi:hypothetical protein